MSYDDKIHTCSSKTENLPKQKLALQTLTHYWMLLALLHFYKRCQEPTEIYHGCFKGMKRVCIYIVSCVKVGVIVK